MLLGARFALTRQFESLQASLEMAKATLGHLAVGFIRPALEEFLWLKYLATVDSSVASELYLILGVRDVMRSVEAAEEFIGADGMTKIGFPPNFSAYVSEWLAGNRRTLRSLNQRLGWPSSPAVATMQWIARQVGEEKLYVYLYSATSRAVHFSAGEVLRRSWGDPTNPDGYISVEDVDHRVYLSDFALYQLTRLFLSTWLSLERWHDKIMRLSEETVDEDRVLQFVEGFYALAAVPIILAKEYELIWKRP